MVPQDVVLDRVAEVVEHDPVDGVGLLERQIGRGDLVRLDQPQVQVSPACPAARCWSGCRTPRRPRPEPSAWCAAFRPASRPGTSGRTRVPRTDWRLASGVSICSRGPVPIASLASVEHDAAGVAVVGHFVAGAVAEDPPHFGAVGRVGTQAVRVGPVAAVVVRGRGRVVAGAHHADRDADCVPSLPGLCPTVCETNSTRQSAPGGTSLLNRSPRVFDLAAFFEAR